MDKMALELLGLQRAEYEKAKTDETARWVCQMFVAAVGLASIFAVGEVLVYLLAMASFFSTILKWWFSAQSKSHKSVSDRARRLILLIEGLGYKISSKEVTDVIATFSGSEEQGKKYEDPDYFETQLDVGNRKFCIMLQESAFFSKHLFEISKRQASIFAIVALIISTFSLLALPLVSDQNWAMIIARVVIVVLVSLISTDLLDRTLAYSRAASIASETDDRLDRIKESTRLEHDLIVIFGDYNAGVESAPLISTSTYRVNKERLNKLWARRRANQD